MTIYFTNSKKVKKRNVQINYIYIYINYFLSNKNREYLSHYFWKMYGNNWLTKQVMKFFSFSQGSVKSCQAEKINFMESFVPLFYTHRNTHMCTSCFPISFTSHVLLWHQETDNMHITYLVS